MSTLKVNQIQNLNGDVLLSSSGGDANLTLSGELRGPATFVIDPAAVGDNTGTVQIKGNLQVDGTQTTINSSTLTVDDKNIVLADGATTDAAADGGGITLKGATDKTFNWVDSTAAWTSSEHINIASSKAFYINGTSVLSATTLGSTVTSSSLTSVGTIATGIWQGSAISASYLDSTVVTTSDTGSVTSAMISDGTIVNGDVNASAAIAGTKISPDFGSQIVKTTGNLLVGTGTARTNIDYAFGSLGSQLQIEQANTITNLSLIQNYDTGTIGAPAILTLGRSGATSVGSTAIVADNNRVGEINFSGSDGSNFTIAACIRGEVDGSPGVNTMPGRLVFSTTSTAQGASPSPRMTIKSNGNVGIGTTDPSVKLDVRTTKSSTVLYAEGRAEFISTPNWNYSGLNIIRESTNTTQIKLISFMLGGDSDADTNLYNYPNIVLRTTSTPISTSTSVGLSAKLEITAPTGVDLGVGTKPILKTTSAGVDVNGSITESTDGGTTYHNVVTAQDIGTDPNQVPLNQFLGQLAFMDEIGDVPTASSAPQENLSVNFEYVSNTSIRIRMRGSDGVVRSTTLTLS